MTNYQIFINSPGYKCESCRVTEKILKDSLSPDHLSSPTRIIIESSGKLFIG